MVSTWLVLRFVQGNLFFFFFFNDTATTEIYTLSLHDALPIYLSIGSWTVGSGVAPRSARHGTPGCACGMSGPAIGRPRSEEHTSELQSRLHLVCRLLLEKKKKHRHLRRTLERPHGEQPHDPHQ